MGGLGETVVRYTVLWSRVAEQRLAFHWTDAPNLPPQAAGLTVEFRIIVLARSPATGTHLEPES